MLPLVISTEYPVAGAAFAVTEHPPVLVTVTSRPELAVGLMGKVSPNVRGVVGRLGESMVQLFGPKLARPAAPHRT